MYVCASASVRACALTIQFIVKSKRSLYSAHTHTRALANTQQGPKLKQQTHNSCVCEFNIRLFAFFSLNARVFI